LPNSQVSFSGAPQGDLRLAVDSSNLEDLHPILMMLPRGMPSDFCLY